MIAQNYGRIVNIASIAGKEGNPNAAAYSASKAGVIALTKSLGKELAGHDIAVNCITPAAAKTAIFDQMTQQHIDYMLSKIPRGRFVEVEEIAALVGVLRLGRVLVHHRRGVRHLRRAGDLLMGLVPHAHRARSANTAGGFTLQGRVKTVCLATASRPLSVAGIEHRRDDRPRPRAAPPAADRHRR